MARLQATTVTIDGEAVCCDDAGMAVFEKLQSRAHDGEAFLYAFDLLDLDGEDWRPRSLDARKTQLERLLAKAPAFCASKIPTDVLRAQSV
jgi:bifunctional non-homologous end joining protein LigD